nr:MAG TPA: hypothetical protein [Caudoviricetes sp.]
MKKIYIVKKVFEDEKDNRNRYPVNSLVNFDDEARVNNLIERGLIKEFIINEENEASQSSKKTDVSIENEDKIGKKKKGDK